VGVKRFTGKAILISTVGVAAKFCQTILISTVGVLISTVGVTSLIPTVGSFSTVGGATQENAEESAQSWRDFCGVVFQRLFYGVSIAVDIQEQLRGAFYIVQIPARVISLKRA
jgi:hypothetical protein